MNYYILKGREVKTTGSMIEWSNALNRKRRQIGDDTIDGARVSTVFLGIDHGWREGPPVLFETMIFGGTYDQWQERYCTYDEAEASHKAIVERLKAGLSPTEDDE